MKLMIRSIYKTYPRRVRGLQHVTFSIPVGMFGLPGSTRASKSTLMYIYSSTIPGTEVEQTEADLGDGYFNSKIDSLAQNQEQLQKEVVL